MVRAHSSPATLSSLHTFTMTDQVLLRNSTASSPARSPGHAIDAEKAERLDGVTADSKTGSSLSLSSSAPQCRESAFAGISKKEAIKVFRRPVMYCMFALFGVMMDGFQMSLPGMRLRRFVSEIRLGDGILTHQAQLSPIEGSSINLGPRSTRKQAFQP